MARKTVPGVNPATEEALDYLFRVPTVKDFWIVRGDLPIPDEALKALGTRRRRKKAKADASTDDMQESLAILKMADALLLRCCIRPKLLPEVAEEVADGSVCLEEIDPMWRMNTFSELSTLANLEEAAEAAGK